MWSSLCFFFFLGAHAAPAVIRGRADPSNPWQLGSFNNLVTFGNSYTDENRLGYFINHNGMAPPPGTVLPESFTTSSGGRTWARYVVQYAGTGSQDGTWAPKMTLYNYAVSGAVCSNNITPRFFSNINADFPSVAEYEVPAFLADLGAKNPATFTPALAPSDTVYAMWIGTNDLGINAFFTDSQVPGTTLVTYLDCVYSQLDRLYASGARYFVLLNVVPLYLAPLYATASEGGITGGGYWPDKPSNLTAIAEKMQEYVTTVDALYAYRTPYEIKVANRYPGANFALFDVNQLILDLHANPSKYFNGTAPANATGFSHQCDANGACTNSDSPDSFLWYDALHPSEQTDRIIASNFINLLGGNSAYARYF